MKRFFLTMMMALVTMSMFTATVEAKRLGGGGSYGRQAGRMAAPPSAPMRQAPAAPMRQAQPAPAYPAPMPQQQQARPGMGGMVGGALLGLGVGSMMGNHANANNANNGATTGVNPNAVDSVPAQTTGGGSSLLMILVVAGIAYFLYRRFRR